MVTHIFKDGTVRTDLTDVYLPAALMEEVVSIARRRKDRCNEEKRSNTGTDADVSAASGS